MKTDKVARTSIAFLLNPEPTSQVVSSPTSAPTDRPSPPAHLRRKPDGPVFCLDTLVNSIEQIWDGPNVQYQASTGPSRSASPTSSVATQFSAGNTLADTIPTRLRPIGPNRRSSDNDAIALRRADTIERPELPSLHSLPLLTTDAMTKHNERPRSGPWTAPYARPTSSQGSSSIPAALTSSRRSSESAGESEKACLRH